MIALVLLGTGERAAHAQSDELVPTGFLNVDVGAQPQRQSITLSSSFPLYDETASVTATQRIRNGGVFDVSGGVRIARNIAAGVGYSQFGRTGTGSFTASIPSPAFFDRPVTVAGDASDLVHKERTIHGRISYFVPVSDSFNVSVSGGPSYIQVKQGLATGITVTPGTQKVTVTKVEQSGHTIGANGGIDGNYMLRSSLGIGVWVRYTYGKLDLDDVKGMKVGGLQGGLGLRARF